MNLLEPVHSTLVCAFYATAKTKVVSITTKLRGIEITLTRDLICEILGTTSNGVHVYKTKSWPQITGFVLAMAIKRICNLPQANSQGKPSASNLTVKNRT